MLALLEPGPYLVAIIFYFYFLTLFSSKRQGKKLPQTQYKTTQSGRIIQIHRQENILLRLECDSGSAAFANTYERPGCGWSASESNRNFLRFCQVADGPHPLQINGTRPFSESHSSPGHSLVKRFFFFCPDLYSLPISTSNGAHCSEWPAQVEQILLELG